MSTSKNALPLETFGVLVRETRLKRNLTQQRAARGAGVSRKQWALLEQGHNASALFIQKVAAYLELGLIPLGAGLQATTESGDLVDVSTLFGLADELVSFATSFADRLRAFAIEAVLPSSERSQDAEAIAEFVARATQREASGSRPVTRAIRNLTADVSREPAKGRATKRKRSKREG
jgi:transcriptional regulator with XRE-family HTH domain